MIGMTRALFDEVEQVLPGVVVERGNRGPHGQRVSHVHDPFAELGWPTCRRRVIQREAATAADKCPRFPKQGQTREGHWIARDKGDP